MLDGFNVVLKSIIKIILHAYSLSVTASASAAVSFRSLSEIDEVAALKLATTVFVVSPFFAKEGWGGFSLAAVFAQKPRNRFAFDELLA